MTDQNIHTELARYRVKPTGQEHEFLPPIALFIDTGAAAFADWLTAEQALELGSALCAEAVRVETERDQGSVMDASVRLVDAAGRFESALGEGRR